MFQVLKDFLSSEDGAVTVDWVVLTAAIVVLAAAIGASVVAATIDGGNNVSASVVANST